MDITIPMRPSNFFDETICLRDVLAFENDDFDLYATAITMANYKAMSIFDIVQKQLHLSSQNRNRSFLSLTNTHGCSMASSKYTRTDWYILTYSQMLFLIINVPILLHMFILRFSKMNYLDFVRLEY